MSASHASDHRSVVAAVIDANRFMTIATADAHQVPTDELADAIETFSRTSVEQGLSAWNRDDVTEPRQFRMYEAIATKHWILGDTDVRIPVSMP